MRPAGPTTGLYVAEQLAGRGIAFLHLSEPDWAGGPELTDGYRDRLRAVFPGTLVAAGGYDLAKAQRVLDGGWADAIAFGRPYIANPDLAVRLERGLPLTEPDPTTFYGGDGRGYTDYPAYA